MAMLCQEADNDGTVGKVDYQLYTPDQLNEKWKESFAEILLHSK